MPYISGSNRSVDTGNTYFAEIARKSISGNRGAKEKLNRERIERLEVYKGKALKARIEHARWIVDCPNCNSAEFAFEDKLFFCSLCKNSDIGGKVRKVKMPTERKKIEEILSVRPIKNRHWTNETLQGLAKENELHLEVM